MLSDRKWSNRPAYIHSLELFNFRLFEHIEVEFEPTLTVLVAPNGGGKSTVLDALAHMLKPYVDTVLGGQYRANLQRDDLRVQMDPNAMAVSEGKLVCRGALPVHDRQADPFGLHWTAEFRNRIGGRFSQSAKWMTSPMVLGRWAHDSIDGWLKQPDGPAPVLPVLAYYRTDRRFAATGPAKPGRKTKALQNRLQGYVDWDRSRAGFSQFEDWFWRQSLIANGSPMFIAGDRSRASAALRVVNDALAALRPHVAFRKLVWDGERWAMCAEYECGIPLPVRSLSDGMVSMLTIVGDLAHRCVRLNPELGDEAALKTPGIVLIDEVDMHLHPAWQQTVLGSLTKAFPKVQFIVTTHSPQVLSTVRKESVRVISVEPNGSGRAEMPDVSTLGREAGEALVNVFETDSKPQSLLLPSGLGVVEAVHRLEQYVRAGKEEEQAAQDLLHELVDFGVEIPAVDLKLWRFMAGRQKGL